MLFQINDLKHIITNQHEELLVEKRKVTQSQDQVKDACIDIHLIDDEGIERPMHLIDNEELERSIPELLLAENQNIPRPDS